MSSSTSPGAETSLAASKSGLCSQPYRSPPRPAPFSQGNVGGVLRRGSSSARRTTKNMSEKQRGKQPMPPYSPPIPDDRIVWATAASGQQGNAPQPRTPPPPLADKVNPCMVTQPGTSPVSSSPPASCVSVQTSVQTFVQTPGQTTVQQTESVHSLSLAGLWWPSWKEQLQSLLPTAMRQQSPLPDSYFPPQPPPPSPSPPTPQPSGSKRRKVAEFFSRSRSDATAAAYSPEKQRLMLAGNSPSAADNGASCGSPIILINGPPFVGKSTVARELARLIVRQCQIRLQEKKEWEEAEGRGDEGRRSQDTFQSTPTRLRYPANLGLDYRQPHAGPSGLVRDPDLFLERAEEQLLGGRLAVVHINDMDIDGRDSAAMRSSMDSSVSSSSAGSNVDDIGASADKVDGKPRLSTGSSSSSSSTQSSSSNRFWSSVHALVRGDMKFGKKDKHAKQLKRARACVLETYVPPADDGVSVQDKDPLVIVTDCLYDNSSGRSAADHYKKAALLAGRPLVPVYLLCGVKEHMRRFENRAREELRAAGDPLPCEYGSSSEEILGGIATAAETDAAVAVKEAKQAEEQARQKTRQEQVAKAGTALRRLAAAGNTQLRYRYDLPGAMMVRDCNNGFFPRPDPRCGPFNRQPDLLATSAPAPLDYLLPREDRGCLVNATRLSAREIAATILDHVLEVQRGLLFADLGTWEYDDVCGGRRQTDDIQVKNGDDNDEVALDSSWSSLVERL